MKMNNMLVIEPMNPNARRRVLRLFSAREINYGQHSLTNTV